MEGSALLSSLGAEVGSGIGFSYGMFKLNSYDKVDLRSLVEFLWIEVGTEVVSCDRISDERYVGKLEGLCER